MKGSLKASSALRISLIIAFIVSVYSSLVDASVIAQEKFTLIIPAGMSNFEIKYTVSIEDAGFFEEIRKVEVAPSGGVKVEPKGKHEQQVTVNGSTFSLVPTPYAITTTVTEVRKNKLRKKDFTFTVNDERQIIPNGLPGFEFKSGSNGIYTLFNDSSENWIVNQLIVNLNDSYLNLDDFDLSDPPTYWTDLLPYVLSGDGCYYDAGKLIVSGNNICNFDLGVELLLSNSVYSQAFVEVQDNIGWIFREIQQHQHDIPTPSSLILSLTGITVFIYCKKVKKQNKMAW